MQFIIGDIHGCFYTFQKLFDKILAADQNPKFVFVGDYCDRGLHSKEVIDALLELNKKWEAVFLRGNHDDVIDWLLNGHALSNDDWKRDSEIKVWTWWAWNGLITTVNSYGITFDGMLDSLEAWRAAVPEEHKQFFRYLPLYWENETHFACHAYVRPTEELPRDLKFMPTDRNDEALWSRFPCSISGSLDVHNKIQWDKIGVFGHTPTPTYQSPMPIKFDKIRLIDTGAFTDNYLTAYNTSWDDWILQATDSRDISR
jgi:serine/threonine protein phosphatase 1